MATPAQIAANRRNAAKSTGPKTSRGKQASSQNAVTHGLTATLSDDDVRRMADIISVEFPEAGRGEGDPSRALLLLHLAQAEARLGRARKAERDILARGDADLRLIREIEMIDDLLWEDRAIWRDFSASDVEKGLSLKLRISGAGQKYARRTYAALRRQLREAEAEQAAALRAWLAAQ